MKNYFDEENYTGNHLHVDNYKDQDTPFIEGIAWVRKDKSLDVFFNEFHISEYKVLFGDKEHYYNDFRGVFLGNAKTDQDAFDMFREWVEEILIPHRQDTSR